MDYPSYSSKKLGRIVTRDYGICYNAAITSLIIQRFKLYFRATIQQSRKRALEARQVWKQRKPYGLKADKARTVVEFDMKRIYNSGTKQYVFVAIDIFTKGPSSMSLSNRVVCKHSLPCKKR